MHRTGNKCGSHAFLFINQLDWSLKSKTKQSLLKHLKGAMSGVLIMLLLVLVSCSEQELISVDGEEITTSISLKVPDVFRSRSASAGYPTDAVSYLGESGMPSIGNLDLKSHPLTFTVGVYVEKTVDGNKVYTLVDKQSRSDVEDDKADFSFRLMKGQPYRIVAYADFSGKEQENLDNISITPGLNDELKDAFFVTQDFVANDDLTVVLKRPFGKLRLVAHDFNTFAKGEVLKIESVKVTYGETATAIATNSFNAITGKFNEISEGIIREFTADPVVYAKEHEGETTPYAAVFTMYLPANFGTKDTSGKYTSVESGNPVPQSWMYPFNIEVTYINESGQSTMLKRSFEIDIPVKRNWLTTIDAADFWTDNSNITVSIDHRFEGFTDKEPETVSVMTAGELQAAIDKICDEALAGKTTVGKIVLGSDIDARDRVGFKFDRGANDKIIKIHLDLKGHTITTDGTVSPEYADGLFQIYGVNCQLYIDDSNETKVGGLKFEGDASHAYPLVYCRDGGQVTINRGNFITTSPAEAIYIQETEYHRALVQRWCLTSIGIKRGSTDPKPTDSKVLASIERNVKKWSATATINGGWFENGFTDSVEDPENVLINPSNAREYKSVDAEGKKTGYWADYSHALYDLGYPEWTKWGDYVNQTFSFIFINGGSFVNFCPSRGDNIVGNKPENWVDDDHVVLTETDDGKTIYTVIPKNSPEYN